MQSFTKGLAQCSTLGISATDCKALIPIALNMKQHWDLYNQLALVQ
jgi:hypothetical protein